MSIPPGMQEKRILSQKTELLPLKWKNINQENLSTYLTVGRLGTETMGSQSSDTEKGNVLTVPQVASNSEAFSGCLRHKHTNPVKSKVPPEITEETTAAEGSVPRVC